ncbi:MAG: amidase [Chloroflexota bacterium]|nr:amidase [Chloroflexota bacterium]MDE2885252.1 amidase [Chloroflexota bacterium]
MNADDLCYLSISEAAELIREKKLSPVELTQAHIDRIDRLNPQVKAYVTRTDEEALARAKTAEAEINAGRYQGPLHGIPVSFKDLYDTAGTRTTGQSRLFADRIPTEDSATVASVKQAGAVSLGKVALAEFGLGGSPTSLFETPNNPWNLDYSPGGSSSGSGAALAAGLCMGSFGTDTGGSLRNPGHCSGIVGLKPTLGRVSRFGVIPCSWSLDTVGPMARTVSDVAVLLQAVAGHDPRDPSSADRPVPDYSEALGKGVEGLRIGVPRDYFFRTDLGADAEVVQCAEQALVVLEDLGASIQEVSVPSVADARSAQMVIMHAEAFAYHRQFLRDRAGDYGPVRFRFWLGALYTAEDYLQASLFRRQLVREVDDVLGKVDLIVTPTMPRPAPKGGDSSPFGTLTGLNFLAPFNLTGSPAVSVPCGFTSGGLPVGLQIAGAWFDEATVLRAAHAYAQATPWWEMHPDL